MACFMFAMGVGIITLLLRKFFPKRLHIEWLNAILWGAVVMLAVEHLAHGEIVAYPPFLTAGLGQILPEIISVGGTMTAVSTGIWASMVGANGLIEKKMVKINLTKIATGLN